MASYDDKVVKKRRPEALKKIAEWKKEFCAPFTDDAEGRPTLFPVDGREEALTMGETLGRVRIDDLRREIPIFDVACKMAEERRFLHWELTFADIFEDRGGFDLILGNPPWVKVEWNETGILSDLEPSFAIHKLSASRVRRTARRDVRGEPKRRPGKRPRNGVFERIRRNDGA